MCIQNLSQRYFIAYAVCFIFSTARLRSRYYNHRQFIINLFKIKYYNAESATNI